jgi:hypothetical protein
VSHLIQIFIRWTPPGIQPDGSILGLSGLLAHRPHWLTCAANDETHSDKLASRSSYWKLWLKLPRGSDQRSRTHFFNPFPVLDGGVERNLNPKTRQDGNLHMVGRRGKRTIAASIRMTVTASRHSHSSRLTWWWMIDLIFRNYSYDCWFVSLQIHDSVISD